MTKLHWSYPVDPDTDALKIAGIDTNLGLKRIGGKRQRYESLLHKFAGQQAGAAETIRAAVSVGDASTAEREAHSLRGAASTLGATDLAEQAAKVETAIKTGQSVDETLASLSHSLGAVVEAIRAALPV
jgi:two-component system, sensor histidine kinase and response regulator